MLQRFYFHLVRKGQRIVDRTGVDLDENALMSLDVEMIMKGVWPGISEGGWDGWSVEITDQAGRIVRTVALISPQHPDSGNLG